MADLTQNPPSPDKTTFYRTDTNAVIKELKQWREFGHNAFVLLFTTAQERPDHKWLNDYGWMSSTALLSDLNNLLKTAIDNDTEAKGE